MGIKEVAKHVCHYVHNLQLSLKKRLITVISSSKPMVQSMVCLMYTLVVIWLECGVRKIQFSFPITHLLINYGTMIKNCHFACQRNLLKCHGQNQTKDY